MCFYVHMHCVVAATAVFVEIHELAPLFTGGVCSFVNVRVCLVGDCNC